MSFKTIVAAALALSCILVAVAEDRPALALDAKGRPVLAWIQGDPKLRQAFVKQWDGSAWRVLGGSLNNDMRNSVPYVSLALGKNGKPVVAWAEEERGRPDGQDFGKIWVAYWENGVWNRIASSPSRSESTQSDIPVIRLDSKDRPFVFWNETSRNTDVDHYYLSRWSDPEWVIIDPGTISTDLSSSSRGRDFAVSSRDLPILAWSLFAYKKDFNVFAGNWDGTRWIPLGSSLNIDEQRYASAPSIVLDTKDRPVVAFVQAKTGFDLWVKQWTGTVWETLGGPLNNGSGGARNPRVSLDKSGNPVVAYVDNMGNDKLWVRAWDGKTWRTLGTALNKNPTANALFYSLCTDSAGRPFVAWSEVPAVVSGAAAEPAIYIARWDGSKWQDFP